MGTFASESGVISCVRGSAHTLVFSTRHNKLVRQAFFLVPQRITAGYKNICIMAEDQQNRVKDALWFIYVALIWVHRVCSAMFTVRCFLKCYVSWHRLPHIQLNDDGLFLRITILFNWKDCALRFTGRIMTWFAKRKFKPVQLVLCFTDPEIAFQVLLLNLFSRWFQGRSSLLSEGRWEVIHSEKCFSISKL